MATSSSVTGYPTGTTTAGGAATGGSGGAATGGSGGGATGGAAGEAFTDATSGNPFSTGSGAAGAPPEASCAAPRAACGGDVVGTWQVASSCLGVSGSFDLQGLGLGCLSTPVTGNLAVGGALTFHEDGTLLDVATTTGWFEIPFADPCLTVSCASVTRPLEAAFGYETAICLQNMAVSECSCIATVDQIGAPGYLSLETAPQTTYTTADDTLIISQTRDLEYDYCVSGSIMTLVPRTETETGTVTGEIVLVKR